MKFMQHNLSIDLLDMGIYAPRKLVAERVNCGDYLVLRFCLAFTHAVQSNV